MGLGGLGGRGGWQARQFVCRRHKLVRPRDIQTRPDASRAPLICLASEQVHSSSSSSWFSWNSKSSSAGSSCPFSLCAGTGNFLISYDYSRICHLFTQTHGGRWKRVAGSLCLCLSLSNNGNICCDSPSNSHSRPGPRSNRG